MILSEETSAAGAMVEHSRQLLICESGEGYVTGTVSISQSPNKDSQYLLECLLVQTNSGVRAIENSYNSSISAIMELRRISGLTWEQLARLFVVSRRSLHFWASGKPLSTLNEEHLQRLLSTLRTIDRGNASENRSLLFSALPDGAIPYDLLVAKQYEEVIDLIGPGTERPRTAALSNYNHDFRTPRRPHELVGALQDSAYIRKGRLLRAIPINTRGKG